MDPLASHMRPAGCVFETTALVLKGVTIKGVGVKNY